MTLIWGTNYSIVKSAFSEVDPQAFNAIRMSIGSGVFLAIIASIRRLPFRHGDPPPDAGTIASIFYSPARLTARDWLGLLGLAVVGHALYQFLFIGGLARTSVANSSLLLAATPVVIALISAPLGRERVSRLHWAGAGLSMLGISTVVGHGAAFNPDGLTGDLMMIGAVCCWAVYTIGAQPLMQRHSPVGVTGLSMALGTLFYIPLVWDHVRAVSWPSLGARTWLSLLYS